MSISLQAIVALDTAGFTGPLSALKNITANATGALMASFGGVTTEILAMGKAFGPIGAAVSTLKNVSSAGMGLEQAMVNIASLTSEGAAAIGQFGQIADEVTGETKFGFSEVSEAMQMFAAAGYESSEVMKNVLKPGLDLAAAGGTTTANAVSVMVSALKTFSLEADQSTRVANLFAGGANVSMASVESLGESMTYAGSAASAYGMKLDETIGVLSLYADKGMQGSVAGTAFAQSLAALTKAAQDGKGAIGEALAGWNPAAEGMTGAIKRLETAGISAQQVLGEFGRQGGRAVASLLNSGSEAIANYTKKVGEVGDAAGVATQRQNTLGGALRDLRGELERLQFALFAVIGGGLKELVDSTINAVKWINELAKAVISGDWNTARGMLESLFNTIRTGAMEAFQKVMDYAGKFGELIAVVKEYGRILADNIGLPATFNAMIELLNVLRPAFERVKAGAIELYNTLANVNWSQVLQTALKLLDATLSGIIGRIKTAVTVIYGLIDAWRNMADGVKVAIAAIAGTAGITYAVTQMIITIEAAGKAMIAMSLATKANLISAAETAYIKMLLLGDAIKKVTIDQAGMVVGAAALGISLGLLIRQIPGVANAIDSMTIKIGQFLGLVEKQDPALKANAERLAKLRQEKSDLLVAEDEARRAMQATTQEQIRATIAAEAQAEALNEQEDAAALARNEMIKAAEAQKAFSVPVKENSSFLDAFTKKQNEAAKATLDQIVAMRAFAPASSLLANGMSEVFNKVKPVVDEVKVSITDLVKMLAAFKDSKINSFDVTNFVMSLQRLAAGIKGIAFENIKMPDFSELKIPDISSHAVENFLTQLRRLKQGMMGLDFGSLGKMNINIAANGADSASTLNQILSLLKQARGVVWA